MAWSPLGGGRLFDPADAAGMRLRATMAAMAGRYGDATPDALAHAWVLAHPSRPLSILGTTKPERVASSARADAISLEREDWYAPLGSGAGTAHSLMEAEPRYARIGVSTLPATSVSRKSRPWKRWVNRS